MSFPFPTQIPMIVDNLADQDAMVWSENLKAWTNGSAGIPPGTVAVATDGVTIAGTGLNASPLSVAALSPLYDATWGQVQSLTSASATIIGTTNLISLGWVNKTSPSVGTFSNGVLTVGAAGLYHCSANAAFASNSTGTRYISVTRVNSGGSPTFLLAENDELASTNATPNPSVSQMAYCNVGDELYFSIYQNSGSTLTVTCYCTIAYVHE